MEVIAKIKLGYRFFGPPGICTDRGTWGKFVGDWRWPRWVAKSGVLEHKRGIIYEAP